MKSYLPNLLLDEAHNLLSLAAKNKSYKEIDELVKIIAGITLEKLIEKYDQGAPESLIYIVEHCFRFDIDVPERFKVEFNQCVAKWKRADVTNLDQAFGVVRKQFRKDAQKRKLHLMWFIYGEVIEKHQSGQPIDEYMFEQVGALYGIGKTTAANYFYEAKSSLKDEHIITDKILKCRVFKLTERPNSKQLTRRISKLPRKK